MVLGVLELGVISEHTLRGRLYTKELVTEAPSRGHDSITLSVTLMPAGPEGQDN